MDKRQKRFIIIIILLFISFIILYIVSKSIEAKDLKIVFDNIKEDVKDTNIVKVVPIVSNVEDEESSDKIIYITNEEVVEDIINIIINSKISKKSNYEVYTDDGVSFDSLEFLDKDDKTIISLVSNVITYKDKEYRISYDQDKLSELIKSVE